MITSLLKWTKNIIITLRFSILSIFMTLFIVSLLTIITINYREASRTLLYTANSNAMSDVSTSINEEISQQISNTQKAMDIAGDEINLGIIDPNNFSDLINLTVSLANEFYIQEAIYWADTKGTFVDAEYEIPGSVKDSVTSVIIDRSGNKPVGHYIFRIIQENIASFTL